MSDSQPSPPSIPPTGTPELLTPVESFDTTQSLETELVPPGYELLYEIGQGGMGVVYAARDIRLNRDVALKYLLPKYNNHSAAVARFNYEAGITARLQHPGIPPVHEVGTLSDGRPFMAMKRIHGKNLAEKLEEDSPGAGRWLAVFEAICQAVGYAHGQGIIHRDLKPSNIMVGAFGEVQVMDWGLAKVMVMAAPPTATEIDDSFATNLPSVDSSDNNKTRAGSVLGTPAFMPPEQAIGAIDKLDRRSDVFGLGAVLCYLLTGEPPFDTVDGETARQLAAQGKLADAFARLDQCDAEPPLIALAKRCLAVERDDRPPDGTALATEVAQLRREAEQRARQAELQQTRAVVHAAEQKRRHRQWRFAAGLVATVLIAGIIGTTWGMVLTENARADEAKQRRAAVIAHEEAHDARKKAEDEQKAAETARDRAKARYMLALDAFNQMVFGIQNKLETRPGTLALRKELLENAQSGLRKLLAQAEKQGSPDHTLVYAYLGMGDVEMVLGNTKVALNEYESGHRLAKKLVEDHPNNTQAQRDLAISYNKLGDVSLQLGQTKAALDFYRNSLKISLKLAKDDPNNAQAQRDLAVSYNNLGDVSLQLGETKEALDSYRNSLDICLKLAKDDHNNATAQRDLAISYERIGDVSLQLGQSKAALDFYRNSLKISLKLAKDDPNNAQAQRGLAISYERIGDVSLQLGETKEALDSYRNSLNIRLKLAKDDSGNAQAQRDLSVSYDRIGTVSRRLGQTKAALDFYRNSLNIRLKLAKDAPNNAEAQRDLAGSYDNLGNVSLQLGQTKEALDFYRNSLDIFLKLAKDDTSSAQAQRDLAISYINLGDVSLQLGETKEALDSYRNSLDNCLKLAKDDPNNAQAQRDLSVSYNKLGDVSLELGETKEALDSYRKCLDIRSRLAKDDPNNAQTQCDLAGSYDNLGNVSLQLGQTKEALDSYRNSLNIRLKLAKDDPNNAQAQRDLSSSYDRIGEVSRRLGQAKEALDSYRKCLDIRLKLAKDDPGSAQAQRDLSISYNNLGNVSRQLGQTKEALDSYRNSLNIRLKLAKDDPNNLQAQRDLFVCYYNLGLTEKQRYDYQAASAWFSKAQDVLRPLVAKKVLVGKYAKAPQVVADELLLCHAAEQAVARLDSVLTSPPAQIGQLFDIRVRALLQRKQVDDAIKTAECWRDWAEARDKDRDPHRYNAACAYALCVAADVSRREALVRASVALLTKLRDTGYFKDAQRLANFQKDADFAAVREDRTFVGFVESLQK